QAHGLGQECRYAHGLALGTPDEARAILDDKGQAEGEQQAVEGIASVEGPDQDALDDQTNAGGEHGCNQQRTPETDERCDGEGDIAADDEKTAVREIDDIAQVEDERQTERHQDVERPYDEPVGDIEEHELCHGAGFRAVVIEKPFRSLNGFRHGSTSTTCASRSRTRMRRCPVTCVMTCLVTWPVTCLVTWPMT